MIIRHIILSLTTLLIGASLGCDGDTLFKESRLIMDTIVNIKVSNGRTPHLKTAVNMALNNMEELEKSLNKYDRESEVSRINKMRADDRIPIGPDMAFLLNRALELRASTGGAFDVTISPLVDLWKNAGKDGFIPSREEIEKARSNVGTEDLILNDDNSLIMGRDGIKLDLSGIAKGYAVDQAISVLKANGVKNGIVEAGGDIHCFGRGPRNKEWRIGVRNPRKDSIIGVLALRDKAVATSGDYYRFFIKDGKRYSHIIDPRTGYPVSDSPMSVTVIAPDCLTADALATAITVMGPSEGLRFAEGLNGIEAIIISRDGEELRIDLTSGAKNIYEEL